MVDICIVTWNRLDLTKKCIESIHAFTKSSFKIFVADNCSTDGTREYLELMQKTGKVDKLFLLDKNYGIAPASNLLWEVSNSEYFIKLDNDIEITSSDWLESFLLIDSIAERSKIGVISYNFFRNDKNAPVTEIVKSNNISYEIPQNSAEVYGGCVFICKKIHQQLGYWCEDFGMYGWEDTDYGIRLLLSGLKNVFPDKQDIMIHHGETVDPRNIDYYKFKQKKYKKQSNYMTTLFFMYMMKLRNLKMERKYKTVINNKGTYYKLIPKEEYLKKDYLNFINFQKFLKSENLLFEFPKCRKDSTVLFEKYQTVKRKWNNYNSDNYTF